MSFGLSRKEIAHKASLARWSKSSARVLTDEQLAEMKVLRGRGFSQHHARYLVATPMQREQWLTEVSESTKRRHLANPRRQLLMTKRYNARHYGIEFTITEADLDWPTHCPVTGVELYYGGKSGGRGAPRRVRPNAASFDRIDNTLGYVPGNVVIVSFWVNSRKGDATPDQLRKIADFYSQDQSRASEN